MAPPFNELVDIVVDDVVADADADASVVRLSGIAYDRVEFS